MCPYPTAEFFLSSGDSRLLSPGHSYTVAVELEMPESPQNADLGKRGRERVFILHFKGMFMVNLTLYSKTGKITGTSIRSVTNNGYTHSLTHLLTL